MRRWASRRKYVTSQFRSPAPEVIGMKISMFHLMPYRELPADFEQRYHHPGQA
jgi:hypothetical protein